MMIVILQLIRLGLVGLYMLYVAVQEFPKHPDWQD
jgi:hypothetical protein